VKTRKRFGQHFLHDPGVLKRIVEAIDPEPADVVVEIGPGEGALTRCLLERLSRLAAIEIDRDLAAALTREFRAERLSLVNADALEHDFSAYPPGFRVVGNLPYNISTPILFHLARCAERVRDMHFMLQKEVVERMVARPSTPDYGRLSVMLQVRFAMTKLFNVGPGAFRPPPKVESALVRLVPLPEKPDCDEVLLEKIVREAFSARRKTLRNALALSAPDYEQLGIDPMLRPENLSAADYVRVARQVSGRPTSRSSVRSGA
jgi:16S rRNA (adenine1518-N6/adenine1519-N6)-dimethyltransferase